MDNLILYSSVNSTDEWMNENCVAIILYLNILIILASRKLKVELNFCTALLGTPSGFLKIRKKAEALLGWELLIMHTSATFNLNCIYFVPSGTLYRTSYVYRIGETLQCQMLSSYRDQLNVYPDMINGPVHPFGTTCCIWLANMKF